MNKHRLFIVLIGVFAFSLNAAATELHNLSGQDLIQLLLKAETKSKAYHELALRNDPEAEKEFEVFQNKHRNPEVIVCPQENGKPPVYAILSDFLSYIHDQFDDQESAESIKVEPSNSLARKQELLIDVFTSDGHKINPFECNDNVLEGIMMDMNGDGFIERASQIRYGVEGVEKTVVLNVNRTGEHEEPVLSVLFNWGTEEDWDFAFSDRDNDGLVEIDFGPFTEAGVLPEVAFRWDKIQNAYVPTTSVFQNHLIVLDHKKGIWDELARIKKEVSFFPKDSRAVSEFDRHYYQERKLPPEKEKEAKIVSTEYVFKSLKGLTNEEIFTYMGRGKTWIDKENEESPRTTIPKEFWDLSPREAALLILEANRSKTHRSKYKISIASDKYGLPPENYSLAFSESAAHSFIFPNYFLRIDPEGSDLLYSSVTNQNHYMLKSCDVGYSPPDYDFRICPMKYSDAKHVLQTIWWLRQVETDPPGKPDDSYGFFSTADGEGTTQFISNDGTQQSFITAETGGWVSTRWTSSFGDEELIGLISEIFFESLQTRLDLCMKGAPDWQGPSYLEDSKIQEVHKTVKQYLSLFSENQKNISYALVINAIRAAGDFAMQDLRGQLEAIQKSLPKATECEDVEKEIDEVGSETPEKLERSLKLYDKLSSIHHGAIKECAFRDIGSAIEYSLDQIHSAQSSQYLKIWVNEKRRGWPWALWQLKEIDQKAYVEILNSMFSTTNAEDRRNIIMTIFDVDKNTAVKLARDSLSAEQKKLSIAALSILADAGTADESNQTVNSLLDYALDPSTERDSRLKILYVLIPQKNPNRYASPKINETLLKMLDLPRPAEWYESIMSPVAECIFLRSGTQYFDQVLAHYNETTFDFDAMRAFNVILRELSEQQKMKFAEKLRPLFSKGPGMIDEIVTTAWDSNLTMLRTDIEGIATGNPNDVEPDQCTSQSDVEEIKGRCHSARLVSSLWNEKDPFTKLKMLISFYVQNPNFENDDPKLIETRIGKLKSDIEELIHRLKPDERAEINDFLVWCDTKHPFDEFDLRYIPQRNALFSFIRQNL